MRLFVAATLAVLLSMATVQAGTLEGLVVGVTDGESITLLDDQRTQHKIRLAGIDAPEKAQAFGQQSKEHLSSLALGRQVLVETGKQKRYLRTVGKAIIDGRDANLAQVVAGMAWHYKKYEGEQSAVERFMYSSAENTARTSRRGLWEATGVRAPWAWRIAKTTGEEAWEAEEFGERLAQARCGGTFSHH